MVRGAAMGEGVDGRRHGERGGICAAIKCALDLRRAGRQSEGTGQSGGAGRVEAPAEWRRRQSEGAGRVKAMDGRRAFRSPEH